MIDQVALDQLGLRRRQVFSAVGLLDLLDQRRVVQIERMAKHRQQRKQAQAAGLM